MGICYINFLVVLPMEIICPFYIPFFVPYLMWCFSLAFNALLQLKNKGKRKVQGVPQSQTAALSRHQEEEETDTSKQAQIKQTYEKH